MAKQPKQPGHGHASDQRQVNTWVPVDDAKTLDEIAKAESERTKYKITKAEVVRRIIREHIAEYATKQQRGKP